MDLPAVSANIHETEGRPRRIPRRPQWPWIVLLVLWLLWTGLAGAAVYAARKPHLLCLLYHRFAEAGDHARITDANERVYTISDVKFEEQLAALKRLGYRSVSLDEAIAFIDGRGPIPEKSILLTIDDGCRNVTWLAEPVLKRHGLQATLFITTDPSAYVFRSAVPDSERMRDDGICLLDRSIWSVGGHGHTHQPLRDMSDSALDHELRKNRETLVDLTGTPPVAMAVPGNWGGPNVREAAARMGFKYVFVSDPGLIHSGGDSQAIPRINVSGRWSLRGFEKAIDAGGVARRRVGGMLKSALSPVIGHTAAGWVSRWFRELLPTRIGDLLLGQALFALAALLRLRTLKAFKQKAW